MTRSGHGDILFIGYGLACAFVLMVIWYYIAWHDCERYMRKEAVEHGAAEYVLDPATGQSKWRWKVTAEVKP